MCAFDNVEFYLSPALLNNSCHLKIPPLFCFLGNGLQPKATLPFCLDKSPGRPPRLPKTNPDTDSPNSHSLSHKWLAGLFVLANLNKTPLIWLDQTSVRLLTLPRRLNFGLPLSLLKTGTWISLFNGPSRTGQQQNIGQSYHLLSGPSITPVPHGPFLPTLFTIAACSFSYNIFLSLSQCFF